MPTDKSQPPQEFKFEGFGTPRYTQVPDELFDVLMPHLSGAELKVLLYIMRRTFGFKKDSDSISLNQIASGITTRDGRILDSGTGLSKRHVQRALQTLEAKNAIKVNRKVAADRNNEINIYSLNLKNGGGTLSHQGRDKKSLGVETTLPQGVETPVSTTRNSNIQETVDNTTVLQQQDDVVVSLKKLGLSNKAAVGFANEHPAKYIHEKISYYVWLIKNRTNQVRGVGFLIDAIKNDYKPEGENGDQAKWDALEVEAKIERDYTKRREDLPLESG